MQESEMRPHERLEVWERAVDFVVRVYKITENFPREEKFGLTSQIRRAAVSIPANIAEGAARQSSKEFSYFLSNAQGSVSELATEILIARRLGYVNEQTYRIEDDELTSIGLMILGLARSVKRRNA
jgi:four helix bundle protein